MGKFGRSWQLMKTSLSVLRKDKEIMIFPILSFIACVVILLSFFAGFWFLGGISSNSTPWIWGVAIILMYFVLFFIVIFFNTAIIACANIRLEGGDPTVSDGLRIASQNIGRILIWAIISATIGMILQAIRERGGWAGRIIAGVFGIAWTYVTFFIIPVLIYEKKGIASSIRRSASLFKQTWGETIIGSFGFGILFFLLALLGILPIFLGYLLGGITGGIIGLIIAFFYWAFIGVVATATNGIYVAALYQYATKKQLPSEFDASLIPPTVSGF
ncbi:MAG: hypothetical protein JW840_08150 [Candidatus Thermoplasmatota archaeon]|nr:hypothetical protein [Candidatus Thermoplasmatota archaeon]